ncbi:MAG: hypothetical protein AB1649_31800 [Chloroflexota bacterium]
MAIETIAAFCMDSGTIASEAYRAVEFLLHLAYTVAMTKVTAQATLAAAIREPIYQLILAALALLTLSGLLKTIASWPIQDIESVLFGGPTLAAIGVLGIYLQLRRMSSFRFALNSQGFEYEDGSQKHSFPWKDIEAIRLEPSQKRITIWTQKRARYIRYLGITETEFAALKKLLLEKIAQYGIPQR